MDGDAEDNRSSELFSKSDQKDRTFRELSLFIVGKWIDLKQIRRIERAIIIQLVLGCMDRLTNLLTITMELYN